MKVAVQELQTFFIIEQFRLSVSGSMKIYAGYGGSDQGRKITCQQGLTPGTGHSYLIFHVLLLIAITKVFGLNDIS